MASIFKKDSNRDTVLGLAIREAKETQEVYVLFLNGECNLWQIMPYLAETHLQQRITKDLLNKAAEGSIRYILPFGEVTKLS